MDAVIIKSRLKAYNANFSGGNTSLHKTVLYYKHVTTMTEQTLADGNFI